MLWELIAPAVKPVLDKVLDLIPNVNERARAREQFERELAEAVSKTAENQAEINKIEAASSSVFVAGWRPFIGWVCGAAIAWTYLFGPLLVWYYAFYGYDVSKLPIIPTDSLFELVLAMLGLGGLRTFEKLKGVSTK